jgi:hypothetical protein
MVPEWVGIAAMALGLLAGLAVGFLVGVDATGTMLYDEWRERHPEEVALFPAGRCLTAWYGFARWIAELQLPTEPYRGRHRAPRPWRRARRVA